MQKVPTLPPGFHWKHITPKDIWETKAAWNESPAAGLDAWLPFPDVHEFPETDDWTGTILFLEANDPLTGERTCFCMFFTSMEDEGPPRRSHQRLTPAADPIGRLAKAIMMAHEHELWEWLRIGGEYIFDPHSNGEPPIQLRC